MNYRLETFIAFRYFRSRRNESFISISSLFSFLGIMIGVATLIVVMSVMNGFRSQLIDKIVGINGHVLVYLKENSLSKNLDFVSKLEELEEIENISKEIELHAMASTKSNSSGILVKGIDKVDLFERISISENIVEGSLDNFNNNSIIIGSRLASFLNLKLDDKVSLVTAANTTTPFGSIPNTANFEVVAIFDVGMYNYDRNIAFIPRNISAKLSNKNLNYISQIEIFLTEISTLKSTEQKISNLFGEQGNVYTWETIHKELFNALKIEKKVMFLILSLIIFIAAFNLVSSIIMIVKDKERGIGILRSLGITSGEILRIFILIGSIVGILGTLLGMLLGILITVNLKEIQLFLENLFGANLFSAEVYFFNIIPTKIYLSEIIGITSIALLLSLCSTIYPAWRASKIEPANILRYE